MKFICAAVRAAAARRSLPVRGAWIEISIRFGICGSQMRRSPCGERGLKWFFAERQSCRTMSLPVRGAWIEILPVSPSSPTVSCRSPCGERGLKYNHSFFPPVNPGRSPCGERGLKSVRRIQHHRREGRSPCGERGLKSLFFCRCGCPLTSLPVRGAWIEIWSRSPSPAQRSVAPRAGSVD